MIGKQVGRYLVRSRVGAGGMGEVYLASDTQLDRSVALKVLPADVSADPVRRARLMREARLAASFSHPHVAAVLEVFEHESMLVLAMEYVEGESLRARLAGGPLPLRQALRFGAQIADALSAAHRRGVVHRDVKPDNVMITPDGLVKVLDFGLARALETTADEKGAEPTRTAVPQISATGSVMGTLSYLAPEQARGQPSTPESDIFALGVTLYEASTGRRPFEADSTAGVLAAILRDHPPLPSSLGTDLPPELDRVLGRAMAKEPGDRYRDARDMASDLRELRRRIESGDSAELLAGGRPARRIRLGALVAAGILIVAAAGTVAGWLALRSGRAPAGAAREKRLRLLAAMEGSVEGLALSRDGTMIAFAAEENGRTDLFVARTGGGGRVRLTDDAAREANPSFSPDGDRVAFTRWNPDTGGPEIRVVPTLGGEPKLVRAGAAEPAWSSDGARIACISRHPDGQVLVTIAADGTGPRELLPSSADYPFLRHVDWSPDGSRLAVERSQGGVAGEIWLLPSSGGSARKLAHDPAGTFSHAPAFARDGRSLVYSSNRGGATNLWTVPLDSPGEPARLTSGAGPDTQPSVSEDGRVAFVNTRSRTAVLVFDMSRRERREIFRASALLWAPAFSPEGREIAFSRGEINGEWHVWIVPAEGGPARQATSAGLHEIYPRFTPDGAWIVYNDWTPGPDRIWRVPRAGGPPAAVTPARDGDDAYADVSPDGRRIAFTRTEGGGERVYVADLAGGDAQPVADAPSAIPRWSPDGRHIAYALDRGIDSTVRVVEADGSGARTIASPGGWPFWFPDGNRIGYLAIGTDGNEEVRIVRLDAPGPPEPLAGLRLSGRNQPCDVSRDGRFLATTDSVDVTSEIWILE